MVQETMFRTMMQNSHKYTSLKLFCKESLKSTKLNPFCEYFKTVNNGCYGCCYAELPVWSSKFKRESRRNYSKFVSKYDLQLVRDGESSWKLAKVRELGVVSIPIPDGECGSLESARLPNQI